MPRRDKATYLADIVRAAIALETLQVDAGSLTKFLETNYFFRTAERLFQIIGEALYHINNLDRTIPILNKDRIIKLRPLLNHDHNVIESGCEFTSPLTCHN